MEIRGNEGVGPRKEEVRRKHGCGRSEYTCSLEGGRRLRASLGAEGMERDGEKSGRHRASPW